MEKTLVVVESPAKAKTIKKYLGTGFEVKASVGHVKDLPKKTLGVNVDEGFVPEYQVIDGKQKILKELNDAARKADRIFLATDPDREGEAIAWHLKDELKKPKKSIFRVLFNELTEKTIKEAVQNPARLDENKYNAQQARRILDRIVGYQLSPLLWEKVQFGLSAGRVQSVALRLIVDRQNAIDTFIPEESWSITAVLSSEFPPPFEAKLVEHNGKKLHIENIEQARSLVSIAKEHPFEVMDVTKKERLRRPAPPFITSTLQQEASRKLRLTSTRTMRIAQQLYEGIELGSEGAVGLITYMRTDSPRIAPEAVAAAAEYIRKTFGPEYLPKKPNVYKGRKTAQEAHEAIRPTSLDKPPEKLTKFLDKAQLALYTLIWNRFLASQAAPAVFDSTTALIRNDGLLFRLSGSIMKFDGFLRIYGIGPEEEPDRGDDDKDELGRRIPPLKKGDILKLNELVSRQHFSQPPPAFNEASLIKELEEQGIGRPSTYAETVTTIQKRKYVELVDKRFRPTLLGRIIATLLVENFPRLLDSKFTAEMESSLDLIEEGSASLKETLSDFYQPFRTALSVAKKTMKNIKRDGILTHDICPQCGEPILIRSGRYGLFFGCSGYPDCDYTRNLTEENTEKQTVMTDEPCPTCGAPMMMVTGKSGPFLSCSKYPACKTAKPITIGIQCPDCGKGELVQRKTKSGKLFYSCEKYPDCKYSMWYKPVVQQCPNAQCDSKIMEEHTSKRIGAFLQCPKCKTKLT